MLESRLHRTITKNNNTAILWPLYRSTRVSWHPQWRSDAAFCRLINKHTMIMMWRI